MLALITGGNRGIGFAACESLAKKGMKILLGSRDIEKGEFAAKKLQDKGHDVTFISLDVSQPKSIQCAADEIQKQYGSLDVLVNNAGVLPHGTLLELSEKDLHQGIDVNFLGPINLIRTFTPAMIKKGYGRIVNVSSGWGSFKEGLEGPAIYSITKAGLNAVTLTLAQSLPKNVKVNSMCPGWVHTQMGGKDAPKTPEEGAEMIVHLATLPDNGPSGKFFREGKEIAW